MTRRHEKDILTKSLELSHKTFGMKKVLDKQFRAMYDIKADSLRDSECSLKTKQCRNESSKDESSQIKKHRL